MHSGNPRSLSLAWYLVRVLADLPRFGPVSCAPAGRVAQFEGRPSGAELGLSTARDSLERKDEFFPSARSRRQGEQGLPQCGTEQGACPPGAGGQCAPQASESNPGKRSSSVAYSLACRSRSTVSVLSSFVKGGKTYLIGLL